MLFAVAQLNSGKKIKRKIFLCKRFGVHTFMNYVDSLYHLVIWCTFLGKNLPRKKFAENTVL